MLCNVAPAEGLGAVGGNSGGLAAMEGNAKGLGAVGGNAEAEKGSARGDTSGCVLSDPYKHTATSTVWTDN